MSQASHPLLEAVAALLDASPPPWDDVLRALTEHFDCPVGTVHRLDDGDGMLHLEAQRGLPPPVLDKVQVIPVGKGMAGLAAERKEPIQVCNLQTDDSGVARPGAKMTQMEGSLAAPMLRDGVVRGTLGVAKPSAYDFSQEETDLLMAVGALIAQAG
ncbi:MAG: GAF domain-containing protein [Planctomycetota bacterium]